jgi:hypothetical protein
VQFRPSNSALGKSGNKIARLIGSGASLDVNGLKAKAPRPRLASLRNSRLVTCRLDEAIAPRITVSMEEVNRHIKLALVITL